MTANAPESDPIPAPNPEPPSRRSAGPEPVPGLAATPPRELGVMLVSAGLIGVVLPGPGVPALVAGGLILWPKGFGKAEQWVRSRFPEAHRKGIGHINRFLTDLERRYPGSTGDRRSPGSAVVYRYDAVSLLDAGLPPPSSGSADLRPSVFPISIGARLAISSVR